MAKEIESKYLLKYLPDYLKDFKILFQGYLHIDRLKQIRVRLIGNYKAFICVKFMDGNVRDEYEYEIPYEDGEKIFNKCQYTLIKQRYSGLLEDGCHFDIDVYKNGVKIVEVERPTLEYKPILPDWVGECVDGQWQYNNYNLAGFPKDEY